MEILPKKPSTVVERAFAWLHALPSSSEAWSGNGPWPVCRPLAGVDDSARPLQRFSTLESERHQLSALDGPFGSDGETGRTRET
nr:hypothetical protein [Pseudonocardia bannensis]